MFSRNADLTLVNRKIGPWTVPTIQFGEGESQSLSLHIAGYIVNSVTEQKALLQQWKVQIASEVKAARGATAWNPKARFATSLGFRFNFPSREHGYKPLDVENFLKPVVDALAAGLFCDEQEDPKAITHWNFDDSNFNTLLVHRLSDADTPDGEGIALYASSR